MADSALRIAAAALPGDTSSSKSTCYVRVFIRIPIYTIIEDHSLHVRPSLVAASMFKTFTHLFKALEVSEFST